MLVEEAEDDTSTAGCRRTAKFSGEDIMKACEELRMIVVAISKKRDCILVMVLSLWFLVCGPTFHAEGCGFTTVK